eukprot:TRINITY_DN44968_c0_g1_i4.p1 TRINITY_DN44968_c0_g1~~TRINITY_DN44968_c0_g1_i4.p1  ORF type:complete len:257 (-),score=47.14 TRINITY_DN44968_c0_g1_i4:334-1104(-)
MLRSLVGSEMCIRDRATPEGPYTAKHWNISMGTGWAHNGDFTLFKDEDGKAYILYHGSGCDQELGLPCWPPAGLDGTMAVDLLTQDFTSSTRQTSGIFDVRGSEAPVMFQRGGEYFLLTATGCGFCPQGSGARLLTSHTPLGPYRDRGLDINPCEGHTPYPGIVNKSGTECGLLMESCMPACDNAPHEVAAQQAWALRLPLASERGGEQWLWAGDFWGSAPDGRKPHDLQVWLPLGFGQDGMPLPLANLSLFQVRV